MAVTAICIGGSRDGRKMTALHGHTLRVAVQNSIPIEPGVDIVSYGGEVKFETYRLAVIRHMAIQRYFWVIEGLGDKRALERAVNLIKAEDDGHDTGTAGSDSGAAGDRGGGHGAGEG